MTIQEILPELLKLNHADKLRVIEVLAHDLAVQEYPEFPADYEAWSPHDSAGAAEQLLNLLESKKAKNG